MLFGRKKKPGFSVRNLKAKIRHLDGHVLVERPGHYDFCGADLSGCDLRGADLLCQDLTGANLSGADLRGANLNNAHLCRANLDGANFEGCSLIWTDITNCDTSKALNFDASQCVVTRVEVRPYSGHGIWM